ncbi:MAG: hypothetical protein EXS10_10890 [Phycisphaerales bacterium]|nr:hypothetical protein [Phycisphaerales bacterium]
MSDRIARFAFNEIYYRILEDFPLLAPPACKVVQVGAYACASAWRRNLHFNAGLALGPNSTPMQRALCAYRMLGSMQSFIAEVLREQVASPEALRASVTEFGGTDIYLAARNLRRGVVIAGIHLGSFEPALATLCAVEPRVHVLFQPDPMPRFERARSARRRRLGIIEHRVADGVEAWGALQDALRADEAVVIHADRTMPGQIASPMPFLGLANAALPSGPVRLATSLGSPIVPAFCARTPSGLRMWADRCIPTNQEHIRAQDVAQHPAQLALVAAMESAIRQFPTQWMAIADLRTPTPEVVRT